MIRIAVRSIGLGKQIPRSFQVELEEQITLGVLMKKLVAELGESFTQAVFPGGELSPEIILMLNGISVLQPDVSWTTVLTDGDEVILMPLIEGGYPHAM